MDFLCPNHRRQFAELPLQERKDLWLFWMENAHACSEREQWRDAVSLAGSAFDLASLDSKNDETSMHLEMTLAAILVSKVLRYCGDRAGSERVVFRAVECLADERYAASHDGCELKECVSVLLDRSRQAEFFADYLNWPSLPVGLANRACSRVLH
ncbi:hypothetical protein [Marinobacter sp. ATCH36]|uniref:hypothetical protein n=1 Tax=Marinobacter sp. ATCH36 TaxID=2945106 RepID=UPI00202029E9|nr:hypothetical protein [Marinobacter sp. ATCH36]MCL7942763.1 hypothetical protein [Marinobacter sp. ATCH36]